MKVGDQLTVHVDNMGNGGLAIARNEKGKPVFVPFTMPDETVRVSLHKAKSNYAHGHLEEVLEVSPQRVIPRCDHFGVCGSCHFQHMDYAYQLTIKQQVVRDQLHRIGGFKDAPVSPIQPHPQPFGYLNSLTLSPMADGGLGLWSPSLRQVMPIELCHILHPQLMELWQDIDLDLPELRKVTLRVDSYEQVLLTMEVTGVEPPSLLADFPVSVALVLPDQTAVSLVGDFVQNHVVKGREFAISPSVYFPSSWAGAEMLVETVLDLVQATPDDLILDAYMGAGLFSAFLAEQAGDIIGIELNPDAVADVTTNLEDTDNVTVYEGAVEEVLVDLKTRFSCIVLHPPATGLSREAMKAVVHRNAPRLVYVGSDVATLARDGRALREAGYTLAQVQPIDIMPQTYHTEIVTLWTK